MRGSSLEPLSFWNVFMLFWQSKQKWDDTQSFSLADQDTKTVRLDVVADAMGIRVPIGVDHDGCHRLSCPLKKGEKYTLKYDFQVSKTIPNVSWLSFK